MALYAFKDDVSILDQATLNSILSLQDLQLIYTGTQRDAKEGAGVTENSIADYSYCARFTLTGSNKIDRVELELDKDGEGADLVVQIRNSMGPQFGNDGLLLKEVVVPKEFIPATPAYVSIPIAMSGNSGAYYWIVVKKAGDSVNKLNWVGEADQDASYPAYYRAGDSGDWTAAYVLHFRVYSGAVGDLVHGLYAGTGFTTIEYDDEIISKVYRYLPPPDGPAGGIRDTITYTWDGEYLVKGVVT
jgi:hypothetical protein